MELPPGAFYETVEEIFVPCHFQEKFVQGGEEDPAGGGRQRVEGGAAGIGQVPWYPIGYGKGNTPAEFRNRQERKQGGPKEYSRGIHSGKFNRKYGMNKGQENL
jgi:hypothetical protein